MVLPVGIGTHSPLGCASFPADCEVMEGARFVQGDRQRFRVVALGEGGGTIVGDDAVRLQCTEVGHDVGNGRWDRLACQMTQQGVRGGDEMTALTGANRLEQSVL